MAHEYEPINSESYISMVQSSQEKVRQEYPRVAKAANSVIRIMSDTDVGTGVIVEGSKIITATHVIKNRFHEILLMADDGTIGEVTTKDIILNQENTRRDISILRLPSELSHLPSLRLTTGTVNPAVPHFLIGYPAIREGHPWSYISDQPTMHRLVMEKRLTASIYLCGQLSDSYFDEAKGSSGGAIVNAQGEVVGIMVKSIAKDTLSPRVMALAMPISQISVT